METEAASPVVSQSPCSFSTKIADRAETGAKVVIKRTLCITEEKGKMKRKSTARQKLAPYLANSVLATKPNPPWEVLNSIDKALEDNDLWQGKNFK